MNLKELCCFKLLSKTLEECLPCEDTTCPFYTPIGNGEIDKDLLHQRYQDILYRKLEELYNETRKN